MIDLGQASRLFRLHGARLVLYARQWLDRAAAEDVVQDVFVRLMSQRRLPDEPQAWLYRSVRNAAMSARRSEGRRSHREQASAATHAAWFEARPEDLIDATSAQEALQGLDDELREIVVLRIWGQLSFQQIAELTAVPLSTVHDRYRAGLVRVRKIMESKCQQNNPT